MPACRFPEHHNSPAGPAGWIAALIAGAVIVAEWHIVLVVLAVVVVLAVLGVVVLASVRAGRSAPYDAAWHEDVRPALGMTHAQPALRDRTAELELQLAEARAQLAAPQQHLHLHGLDAEQLAAIITGQHNPVLPAAER